MAAVTLDVMPTAAAAAINVGQSRRQSVVTFALTSTPFPVNPPPVPDTLIVRRTPGPKVPGILIYQKAIIVEDHSSIVTESDAATGSESSSPSSENGTQGLCVDESPRSRTASSSSSSVSGADSAASSMRTRTTTISSASASPCVTFAPLPEIAPRKRNSVRPLGIAARGQILRERREKMAQDRLSYYDDSVNSIPGGEKRRVRDDWGDSTPQTEGEDAEDALVALGKALGEATKVIWRRVSSSRLKSTDNLSKPLPKRPSTTRSFTWPGRLRTASIGSNVKTLSPASARDSDEDTEEDGDGSWRRRRDEDPMTKTIVEGSDDGHGLEQFVLEYDAIPATEEEEGDHTQARVDDEIRNTVEVHLVKAAEDKPEE